MVVRPLTVTSGSDRDIWEKYRSGHYKQDPSGHPECRCWHRALAGLARRAAGTAARSSRRPYDAPGNSARMQRQPHVPCAVGGLW